jgi:hypothetical protein
VFVRDSDVLIFDAPFTVCPDWFTVAACANAADRFTGSICPLQNVRRVVSAVAISGSAIELSVEPAVGTVYEMVPMVRPSD